MTAHDHEFRGPSEILWALGEREIVLTVTHRPRCACGELKPAQAMADEAVQRTARRNGMATFLPYRVELNEVAWWEPEPELPVH